MSREAMEVVLDHIHARRRQDVDAVSATLDADVIHEGVRPEFICTGRDEVLGNVRRGMEADRFEVDRLEIIDAGVDRAVLGVSGPRFRDAPIESPTGEAYILFTVRSGHIVRMRDFRSRAEAMAAAQSA